MPAERCTHLVIRLRAFISLANYGWGCAPLQNLETLAVTFQTGRVTPADLAPLEQLRRLRALTLAASRQAEEGGLHCLSGFPDSLLKLKGLTSLAISSLGGWGKGGGQRRREKSCCQSGAVTLHLLQK